MTSFELFGLDFYLSIKGWARDCPRAETCSERQGLAPKRLSPHSLYFVKSTSLVSLIVTKEIKQATAMIPR
jgi:hypothetical protein